VISIEYTTNTLAQYKFARSLLNYGVNANINNTRKQDIEITIKDKGIIQVKIPPNKLKSDITYYLLFNNEKVPLFELLIKLIFRTMRITISRVVFYYFSKKKSHSKCIHQ